MEAEKIYSDSESIRQQIIEAAFARFRQYGYNKTTMAEIADDSDMSTANIYRYFENKQAIAFACVGNAMEERIQMLASVVHDTTINASMKLHRFVIYNLRQCHKTYSQDRKIDELIGFITQNKPELVHRKISRMQGLIAEVLETGNLAGEFQVKDITKTARAIYSAIAIFDVPLLIGFYSQQEFEQRAEEVVHLIIHGLEQGS